MPFSTKAPIHDAAPTSRLDTVFVFIASLIVAIGRTTSANRSNLYAEDGATFIQDWLSRPSLLLPFAPYTGYIHLVPRLAAGIVASFSISLWPLLNALLASASLAVVSALVWHALRYSGLPYWARVLLAAIPLLSPLPAIEPIGNLANIHWFLAYLIVFVAIVPINGKSASIGWSAVAVLCTLTEVQCAFVAPVIAYRFFRHRRFRAVATAYTIGMAGQLAAILSAPRARPLEGLPSISSFINGYLLNVVGGSLTARLDILARLIHSHGFAPLAVGALVYGIVCVVLALFGKSVWRWLIIGFLALSVVAWCLAYGVNQGASSAVSQESLSLMRWGTLASMYLLAAGVLALGVSTLRWNLNDRFWILLTVVLCVIWVPSFRSLLPADVPAWQVQLSAAHPDCTAQPDATVNIAIEPKGWHVAVPCRRIL